MPAAFLHSTNKMFFLRCIVTMALGATILPVTLVAQKKSLPSKTETDLPRVSAVWNNGRRASFNSVEEFNQYVVSGVVPVYPWEARRSRVTGIGIYEFRIDRTGKPTEIVVVKSGGHIALDQAAQDAFIRWRFKPGVLARVRMPVTWKL